MRKSGAGKRRSMWRDTRGTSAIEFGIAAPVLLLMLLGTIELGRALNSDRHFVAAAEAVGDLVAREAYMGTSTSAAQSNLDGMMLSIGQIMAPFETSPLKLAVFSVKASATDANSAKVQWSYGYKGAAAPGQCSTYTLPANMIPAGGSVIVVDASYTYKTLFGSYVPGMQPTMKWTDKSYYSPRNSCVDYVKGDNCISKC